MKKDRKRNGKVYIAGKITGDPKYREKFDAGVLHVIGLGWEPGKVVNPVNECQADWRWSRCMVRCLRLMSGCEWVAMLPDWRESRGARIEHAVANCLGKSVIYIY